ncbi:MAG: protein-disulfide reductase DsbD family protein [Bryobacteraceae bacterium]
MQHRIRFAVLVLLAAVLPVAAQRLDPVKWSLSLDAAKAPPGSEVLARFTARIEPGWHLYSLSTPKGPIPTTISVAENPAVASWRVYQPTPKIKFDPNFNHDTETFDHQAVFLVIVKLSPSAAPGPVEITLQSRYQACDDRQCLLPARRSASAQLVIDPGALPASITIPAGYQLFDPNAPAATPSRAGPARATAVPTGGAGLQGLGAFILIAFGFGLAAVFTPCVFPMIPITVSYFLRQESGSRSRAALQALVFSAGIVVLFSSLGLIVTAILGPFGTVQLGANVWVNTFLTALFVVFGLSLLGAFEITLPSGLLTRADRVSQRGGVAGSLLMGLAFSLTAFACVGPFVGALLAGSIAGGGIRPLAGMLAFATGLALPFFFLALFPGYLSRLPKSGGWMARVKVVLGFVILAAALKYASNVDSVMRWNSLTRERFLAAWMVLFGLAGLYLLGLLRLEGVRPDEKLGVTRLLVGAFFLVFALSLAPGMAGGRLGEIDAYVPPPSSSAPAAESTGLVWMKDQYQEALARARAENKLVFVNFTGYACTNCHWMKANMFTRPEIREALRRFVLVDLYTDGVDPASESNQRLLQERFGTVAIPYYAIVDAEEKVIATFASLTRNPAEFLAFLNSGQ